jgi:hypothetical protein
MFKQKLILIIVLIGVIIPILNFELNTSPTVNNYSKDQISKSTNLDKNSRSQELDTSTEFEGETVYNPRKPLGSNIISNVTLSSYAINGYNFTACINNTSSESMNFTLYIRSNATKVSDYNTTTSALGIGIWLLNETLSLVEYQLNVTISTDTNTTNWQPRHINQRDYFEDQKNNSLDYTEGNFEILTSKGGSASTQTVGNGLLNYTVTGTTHSQSYFYSSSLNIDRSYYTYCLISIKGSENNLRFSVETSGGIISYGNMNNFLTTEYQTFILETSDSSTISTLIVDLKETVGKGNFDGNETFYIDFIQLYHELEIDLKEYNDQWYFSSENNSLTYYWYQTTLSGTKTDLTQTFKVNDGTLTVSYFAFSDALYSNTLLLPSSHSDLFSINIIEETRLENTLAEATTIIQYLLILAGLILGLSIIWRFFSK